jgi:putative PIG3 family NAD(P)H quinone oxidoreductase
MTVVDDRPGGSLVMEDVPDPTPRPDEIVIEVAAAGVNRADLSQRAGRYPPPPGASPVPGLECSGTVAARGREAASRWAVGDEVCALLAGGGYAELVAVPSGQVMRAPTSIPLVEAGGLPEALVTVWTNLAILGRLTRGERVLVHGGASGIGTTAIQLARLLGAEVIVTAGGAAKAEACRSLGASAVIDYRREDFAQRTKDWTAGRGVDVVLDLVGADYLDRNIDALAPDGRLVVVGIQSGSDGALDLRRLMAKRAVVTGSVLRARPVSEKAVLVDHVVRDVLPAVEDGRVLPVIDSTFPLAEAMAAHEHLQSGKHIGKLLLVP